MTKEEKNMEYLFLKNEYIESMKKKESLKDITAADVIFSLFPDNWFSNLDYDDDMRIKALKEAMARNMTVLDLMELRENEIDDRFKKQV